jgi:hypothetical protein
MLCLPEIQVADPIHHEALTIFPLLAGPGGNAEYLLADEAIAAGSVTVEEVGEAGSVPSLIVNNQSDRLVLFLEGEELREPSKTVCSTLPSWSPPPAKRRSRSAASSKAAGGTPPPTSPTAACTPRPSCGTS